ncbi:putative metal dependent hydrolase [Methanosarcina siciliae C2J]|uniref:Putative metal dependent hydrolase n=3 Tax=Methanosarcina siciliae TaxID=38027 RepID=A0A0E3L9V4_9EURY|nr:MBL fold metallo-hydrolase [Methanosarcina siciliae]AKB26960.1 putative metal dependent hydrolase [Methanosarcina siciliae T4/M]AKB30926.1 putative metal dependent hydrolase [Methanosarcina siciliae HI350]AKB34862.1 putative metal dependent hydrolase [Methanosarcina siciliae C2J]
MNSVKIEGVNIQWFGNSGFLLEGDGKKIYIDPYQIGVEPAFDDRADILLITHEHFDHCSPEDIRKVRRSDTTTLIPESCSLEFRGDARRVAEGDILADGLEIKGIRIEVVPAYNLDKPYHPRELGVGYIVELEGLRIYHAGDCDFFPEMEGIRADIALLPIGGTYTMDEEEASRAATAIYPKAVIPMHYGSEGIDGDPEKFKALVNSKNPNISVIILDSYLDS